MIDLQLIGTEVSALGAVALTMPLRLILRRETFDPEAPHPTPVVFVHGFLGDPTNFLFLRGYLAASGVRNFATFSYPPRLDYQRLAVRLGRAIQAFCVATGAPHVDVVGHSLGGLTARYLIEMAPDVPVRRLVTLGAPYFSHRLPDRELAIFADSDPFVPPPHPVYGPHGPHPHDGRVVLIHHCGHWGLLLHPLAFQRAAAFLCDRTEVAEVPSRATLFLAAAS
jgi:pimeloyl-ACP methyl ester carboxylesterase